MSRARLTSPTVAFPRTPMAEGGADIFGLVRRTIESW